MKSAKIPSMDSKILREKFLKFFEKNGHTIIPSAPLVPSKEEQLLGKEPVLFTSAGMQPLVPHLMGKPHRQGNKLANVQKCLRTDDIEEVGDATHHTFFEMLGNWSLGAYWKDEAIELSFKFLTKELEIPLEKLAISVFAGDEDAPRDDESANKWIELGISKKRITYLGKEANWWPTPRRDIVTGELQNAFGLCGPDTEMFIWTGKNAAPEEFDSKDPKWVEVWNDVFMEFYRKEDGTLEELPQKNVDTGMGFERMLAVLNGKDNDYETELFLPIIEDIEKYLIPKFKYGDGEKSDKVFRIIADHIKAAVFILNESIKPDNKDRGYIARRLIRNALTQKFLWGNQNFPISQLVESIVNIYKQEYADLLRNSDNIRQLIETEEEKFTYALRSGLRILQKDMNSTGKWVTEEEVREIIQDIFKDLTPSPERAFFLYQSYGLRPEIIELLTGHEIDKKEFNKLFKEHQQVSRGVEAGKFKGGLADHSEVVTKYHTATHLLHQALRDVLGPQVFQKGSNITSERLRFDFSFDRKMTGEEIKKVEGLVNKRIEEDLKVDHMIVPLEKAKSMNAIGLFDEKYADKVSIYGVGSGFSLDPGVLDQRERGGYYSLEFCGGPHVDHTLVIGKIKITKEEAISAGVRRIRAELIKN